MSLDPRRKRLIFRSWHRGTREMDLLMGSFADAHVSDFSEEELVRYEEIMNHNDHDLYSWITGTQEPPSNAVNDVFQKLKKHKYA